MNKDDSELDKLVEEKPVTPKRRGRKKVVAAEQEELEESVFGGREDNQHDLNEDLESPVSEKLIEFIVETVDDDLSEEVEDKKIEMSLSQVDEPPAPLKQDEEESSSVDNKEVVSTNTVEGDSDIIDLSIFHQKLKTEHEAARASARASVDEHADESSVKPILDSGVVVMGEDTRHSKPKQTKSKLKPGIRYSSESEEIWAMIRNLELTPFSLPSRKVTTLFSPKKMGDKELLLRPHFQAIIPLLEELISSKNMPLTFELLGGDILLKKI